MKLTTPTVAILAFVASGAIAEEHMSNSRSVMHNSTVKMAKSTEDLNKNPDMLIRSRDITGGNIYTLNEADDQGWDPELTYNSLGNDWKQVGEIEDLVLTSDGMVTGIVAEVGGILDIGDKHVMISVQDLNLVAVDDLTYAYVTRYNEKDMEEMAGVDEGFWN